MPSWKLYDHILWGTKHRQPLLTAEVEPVIYGFISNKLAGLEGSVFALNGCLDHVHPVVPIPPELAVANFIGQVKGLATARDKQTEYEREPVYWQEEYGVFSFDEKRLPDSLAYVERQKIHHAEGTIIQAPEVAESNEAHNIGEAPGDYFTV